MEQTEFDLHMMMKESYSEKLCAELYTAIKTKFPNIEELDVFIGENYDVTIIFSESNDINRKVVNEFIEELKK